MGIAMHAPALRHTRDEHPADAALVAAWTLLVAAGVVWASRLPMDTAAGGWRWAALTLAIAPWVEEVLFRAGLQTALRRRLPASAAVVVTAFAFAAAHGFVALAIGAAPPGWMSGGMPGGATAVLLAALVSAWAIGWLYERTRRLLPCMVVHAALNGLVLTLQTVAARGSPGLP